MIRNKYFTEIALRGVVPAPAEVTIKSPYWGDYGARMAWDNACLPLEENEQFGGEGEEIFGAIWSEMAPDVIAPPDKLLLTLANKNLARAVDCLWAAAMYTPPEQGKTAGIVIGVLGRRALLYARANPKPAWMAKVTNDDELVEQLLTEFDDWSPPGEDDTRVTAPPVSKIDSFGAAEVWNRMKEATAKLGEAAKGVVTATTKVVSDAGSNLGKSAAGAVINPLVRKARPGLHKRGSLFIGDVFQYLDQRRLPDGGKIITEVAAAFDQANQARKIDYDDLLIIVAHSMGGIISYDILTRVQPALVCDLFVTVGSQVGMFAELGLFPSITIDPNVPSAGRAKVPVPDNIKRWINVFDPADALAYAASRVFDRVEDYAFSSEVSALTAHSMYFARPQFYERLRARILKE